ncbi:hypothetical protein Vadar_014546 [Vaccinium darrowii]|uniref:Uncharacterized protein n=1 Tax=Vaccinium darrowii TaxID=229202 RepID=A0ACB7XZP2_9ERIC|nr:hypothetical protein Vadar_014546 [Vaccinium darrowii]
MEVVESRSQGPCRDYVPMEELISDSKTNGSELLEQGCIQYGMVSMLVKSIDMTFHAIESNRRRCKIEETLIEKNFDVAFQVIYEFNLPAVDIYAGVAASLAERKRGGQLTEFFRSIKGTIDDDDWDQVTELCFEIVWY